MAFPAIFEVTQEGVILKFGGNDRILLEVGYKIVQQRLKILVGGIPLDTLKISFKLGCVVNLSHSKSSGDP